MEIDTPTTMSMTEFCIVKVILLLFLNSIPDSLVPAGLHIKLFHVV